MTNYYIQFLEPDIGSAYQVQVQPDIAPIKGLGRSPYRSETGLKVRGQLLYPAITTNI